MISNLICEEKIIKEAVLRLNQEKVKYQKMNVEIYTAYS